MNTSKKIISRAIIILLFVFVAGMAKGASDTLQFHYDKSVFAEAENEQWFNPAISWKNKYLDYDKGDSREAFLGSRSLFVWLTDAWHLFQTIETLAWVFALLVALCLGRFLFAASLRFLAAFGVLNILAFYCGFLLLYGWLLLE